MKNNSHCQKDSIGHFFDVMFWYVLYALPVVLLLISWCRGSFVPLSQVFTDCGLNLVLDNTIITSISSVFGSGGVFPIFVNSDFIVFVSYFILVFMIHLVVDCLLFVFRAFHRVVNHGFGGASHE